MAVGMRSSFLVRKRMRKRRLLLAGVAMGDKQILL
jgi:hypothetical protein